MADNNDKSKEVTSPLEAPIAPEAAQKGGVISEGLNQAKWRQTQQQHILEQGESATDLFYDPNFKPKDKTAKFELVDDGEGKNGKFIDYKPQQLDKKTFVLGMDHENEPRTGIEKLSDFLAAAAHRASDPAGQQKYIQDELDKIAGIGRGLNNAKDHTKASAVAGWTALADGTVATFLSKQNAINDPLFHAVGSVLEATRKDPYAVDKAMEKVGEIILSTSEQYSKLPSGKQGEALGETLFYAVNPEGSTEAGELTIKIADQVATKVDGAVAAGIEKSVKAAQEMSTAAPELAQQAQQMVLDYAKQLGLTPQEMQAAGIPRGWIVERPQLNENMYAMSDGKNIFRGDEDAYSSINPITGKKKSFINAEGDLTPADPKGLFKGEPVDVVHHLCGSFFKHHKNCSPFTSFGENAGQITTKYGAHHKITADLVKLQKAIADGELSGVQIMLHDEVLEAIRNSPVHPVSRKIAMRFAVKDNEVLIRGVIPRRFFNIEELK